MNAQYWDPVGGSDAGDGSREHPVKTFDRVLRLHGRGPSTTYVLSDMAPSDPPITIPANMGITGLGVPTILTTGNGSPNLDAVHCDHAGRG